MRGILEEESAGGDGATNVRGDVVATEAEVEDEDEDEDGDGERSTFTRERPRRRDVLADAVVGALTAAVAAGPDDTSGADRHLAVVEVSPAALLAATAMAATEAVAPDEPIDGGASAEATAPAGADGSPTTAEDRAVALVGSGRGGGRRRPIPLLQLGRLVCGARLDVVTRDEQGTPADHGTTRRYPDARLRRLALARDRTCRFPSCAAVRFLHLHHVVPWADGGPTDLDNLVVLCGHHHRFIHSAGWVLRPDGPGAWSFHPPDVHGGPAPRHPRSERLPDASAAALHLALVAHADRVDPRALTPSQRDGLGYDHDIAVGVLLDRIAAATAAA